MPEPQEPTGLHEIPTHLNVEDRAFLGLSVRQTLNLMVGVSATYGLWNQWPGMPQSLRATLAGLSLLLTLAFTLIRLHGRGFDEWIFVLLHYLAIPKASVWRACAAAREPSRSLGAWEELNPELSWAKRR